MCLLCLLNFGPVLLLTGMGMAGAAVAHPERDFNGLRAMATGIVVFGLPFAIGQAFVRRGSRGAIFFSIVIQLLFLTGAAYLMINVAAAPLAIQFKLMAGLLSFAAIVGYGLGVVRLFQAAREVRSGLAPRNRTGNPD